MKEYLTTDLRNLVLLGHASSGKTSLAEAMLYTTGITSRLGRIDEGTTTSDYHADEIERKFSITASLLYCEWKKNKINILDTPGYLDFISESKAMVRVADLAVLVVHGQSGVEVGSELVFRFAEEENLPLAFVINMLDKEHANFQKTLDGIRNSFGNKAVVFHLPVNPGVDFDTIVDILSKKMLKYNKGGRGEVTVEEIPADLQAEVDSLREAIIEAVAESDDALLEKFFEQGELSEEEIMTGLKKALLSRTLFPVFATSATGNIGVSSFMDNISAIAPAPDESRPAKAKVKGQMTDFHVKEDSPTSLFVYKTLSAAHIGEISMFKVMSGSLHAGMDLQNTKRKGSERIAQVFTLNGKDKSEIAHMHAGDIGAVVKLKDTHTMDTLAESRFDVVFADIPFPAPVLQTAVIPRARGDEEKISTGLHALSAEDPTVSCIQDPEIKQTILSGQGELHLTVILERLKTRFNVEVNQIPPRIPYRETIRKRGESKYRHKKQTGGAGQFAEVWLYVEPLPTGSGVEFSSSLVGQNVDRVFVPSVEKGVHAASEEGILAGYQVTDVKAVFYDGKMHPVDSKDIAFQIAGKGAFKEAFLAAQPILMEPIYDLEVIVPEDYMGDVMGDISVRRGKIQGMDSEGSFQKITAKVPLAELYRYGTALRSMTQGKGMHRQKFSHYEQAPREIQEKVVAEAKEKREE